MTNKEIFGGKCPYTNEPCETFECEGCETGAIEHWFKGKEMFSNEMIYKELINTQELLHSVSAKVIDMHTRIQYIEKLLDRGKEE